MEDNKKIKGLKLTALSEQDILVADECFEFALINMMSSIDVGSGVRPSDINWEECMEAYFFDADHELHVFREEDGLCGVLSEDDGTGIEVMKSSRIADRFSKCGRILEVCDYLDRDEDGQSYVAYTRLVGIH